MNPSKSTTRRYSVRAIFATLAIAIVIATTLALLAHYLFPAQAPWIQAAAPVVAVLVALPLFGKFEARFGRSEERIGSGPENNNNPTN